MSETTMTTLTTVNAGTAVTGAVEATDELPGLWRAPT